MSILSGSAFPLTMAAIICLIFVFLLFKILKAPLKLAIKLFLHAAAGFAVLWLINFFGEPFGLYVPITWISAIVAGVLGVPGVVLVVLFRYLF